MGDAAIPVTILTGFLGAGKTTLLNRILNGDHGLRIAVLVNDFGSVNIDAELVVGVEDDVISLANGCVCCEVRDDLVQTVTDLVARPEAPEYVLLEASGVADPSGIAMTFVDGGLRDRLRLDSIISIVDADQAFAYPDYPAVQELKLRQVGFSDMVILNKTDLVDEEQLERVKHWIEERLARIRFIEAVHCDVPLEVLLSVGRFDGGQLQDVASRREHQKFSTWTYESDRPLSTEKLREAAKALPASVYRVKGMLYTTDAPDRRGVLQLVGRPVGRSSPQDTDRGHRRPGGDRPRRPAYALRCVRRVHVIVPGRRTCRHGRATT